MTRVPNVTYTALGVDFERATEGPDLFKKEDVQKLAYAVEVSDHSAGYGVPIARLKSTVVLQDLDASHEFRFATANLAAHRTVTWPALSADDTLVFENQQQTLRNKTFLTTDPAGLPLRSNADVIVEIDYDNNQTDRAFRVRKDALSTDLFRVDEGGTVWVTQAVSRVVPGTTSFAVRNNANTLDNLLVTDAGAVTARGNVTAAGLVVSSTALVANLNADQVDSAHASASLLINTIPVRDGNGDIFARFVNATNAGAVDSTAPPILIGTNGTDDYYRRYNATALRAMIQGIDGAGSGIDADLLDGMNASATVSASTIVARNASGYIFTNYLNMTADSTSGTPSFLAGQSLSDNYLRWFTAANVIAFLAPNDGSGSGLDADLLDNQDGAYYQNQGFSATASAPVNLTGAAQPLTTAFVPGISGNYMVVGTFDFLTGTNANDDGMVGIGALEVGGAEQGSVATFVFQYAGGLRMRASVAQVWFVGLTAGSTLRLTARKGGGTGNAQCLATNSKLVAIKTH